MDPPTPLPYPCNSLENPLFHTPHTPLAHRSSSVLHGSSPHSPAYNDLLVPSPLMLSSLFSGLVAQERAGVTSHANSPSSDSSTDAGGDAELFTPDTTVMFTEDLPHADAFPLSFTPRRLPSRVTTAASSSMSIPLDRPALSPTALLPRRVRDAVPDLLSLGSPATYASADERGVLLYLPYGYGSYAGVPLAFQTRYGVEEEAQAINASHKERDDWDDAAGLPKVSSNLSSPARSASHDHFQAPSSSVTTNLSSLAVVPWPRHPQSLLTPPKPMSDLDHESEYSAPSHVPISPARSAYQETSFSIRGDIDDNITMGEPPQSPPPSRGKPVKKPRVHKKRVSDVKSKVTIAEATEPTGIVADDGEGSENQGPLSNNKRTFKVALWEAINNPAYAKVIRWSEGGASGVIPDKKTFEGSKAMKSITDAKDAGGFVRQLHMWGFQRYREGGERSCGFSHPLFKRDRPDLLQLLHRTPETKSTRIYSKPPPKTKGGAGRLKSQAQSDDLEAVDEQMPAEGSETASHDDSIPLRKSTRSVRVKPNYAEENDAGEEGSEDAGYWGDTGSSSRTDDGSWASPSTTTTSLLTGVGTEQDFAPLVPSTPMSAISTPLSELTDLSPESPLSAVPARKPRAPKTPNASRAKRAKGSNNKTPGSPLKRTYSASIEQDGDNDLTPPDTSDSPNQAIASSTTSTTKKSKKRARN